MTGAAEGEQNLPAPPPRRRWSAGAGLLDIALLVVLAMEVNYLSYRHFERWDWTSEGVFTLSERTERELAALTEPVDVYLFMAPGEPNYDELQELLQRYRAASPQLSVDFVDPFGDPARYRRLSRRFDLRTLVNDAGLEEADVVAVVTAGSRRTTIQKSDLVSLSLELPDDEVGGKVDVKAERAITGAIVEVLNPNPTEICVSTGHGERSLDGSGTSGSGRNLAAAADLLRRDRVELREVEIRGASSVDADCDALFVIAPEIAFAERERAAVRDFVRDGGGLLLAADLSVSQSASLLPETGLEPFLAELGIELPLAIAMEADPGLQLPSSSPLGPFLVVGYAPHETTAPLVPLEVPSQLFEARVIEVADGTAATPLLLTSPASWGETNLARLESMGETVPQEDDLRGPLVVAAAAELPELAPGADESERPGRVVVVGDSDWLDGEVLRNPAWLNDDLLRIWTGWLGDRDTLVAIDSVQVDRQPMRLTRESLGFGFTDLGLRLLILMPTAFLILGFATWWSRRA